MIAQTASDKKWQAENDARTLAEAETIKQDPNRLKPAQDAAQKMVDQKRDEANAMAKVAGKKSISTSNAPNKDRQGSGENSILGIFKRISG